MAIVYRALEGPVHARLKFHELPAQCPLLRATETSSAGSAVIRFATWRMDRRVQDGRQEHEPGASSAAVGDDDDVSWHAELRSQRTGAEMLLRCWKQGTGLTTCGLRDGVLTSSPECLLANVISTCASGAFFN